MLFRQALAGEREALFREGYREWPKGRTFAQYRADNAKEDAYGTRFVLEVGGELVSSLILLTLKDLAGKKAYGIGSVLTPKVHSGKGYATRLIRDCMEQAVPGDAFLSLFSDIDPGFYKRFGFRALPAELQRYEKSTFMVHCTDGNWNALKSCPPDAFPDYF